LGKRLALKEQTNQIKRAQLRIKMALSKNQPPLQADTTQVQQYKFAIQTLQKNQAYSKTKEEDQAQLEKELEKLYDADVHAAITHYGVYNGLTRITFIDPKTSQKHAISPQGSVLHVRLRREGEDKKIIFES
jgi:hypothetical protein